MKWQDIVLTVGQWLFIIALLPSVFSKDKPPISTSLLTGVVLLVYTSVYVSYHLWTSTASNLVLAIMWLVIAGQKYFKKDH